jgi:alpha-tubulin suppressor-like RCC1 family protein
VSAGSFFTCGVATSDRAFCWGDNSNGQLGDGTRETRSVPAPVAGAT